MQGTRRHCVMCGAGVNFEISLFQFPKDEQLRQEWANFCGIAGDVLRPSQVLCSRHFTEGDFKSRKLLVPSSRKILKKGVVPTVFDTNPHSENHESRLIDLNTRTMPPRKRLTAIDDQGVGGKTKKRSVGNSCAVPRCSNYAGRTRGLCDVFYYKFPSNPALRDLWVKSIQRGGVWNPDKSHVCSDHFNDDDFERNLKTELLNLKKRKSLKPDAVPSKNLRKLQKRTDEVEFAYAEESEKIWDSPETDGEIIVLEVGSTENGIDGSASWGENVEMCEANAPQLDVTDEGEVLGSPKNNAATTSFPAVDEPQPATERPAPSNQTKETIITFAGCEQSEHLKSEIAKLQLELKAKEDSLFILEQSSAFQTKQNLRIIKELTEVNAGLMAELQQKNERIKSLEEVLATDTKLKSMFAPRELERFLKKAKKWSEL